MKVLLINGSPNEKGCTYTALAEIEQVFKEQKIEGEIIHIGSGRARGCIGCGKCQEEQRCVFTDDITNTLIDKMEKSDGLIIGSPVYYASANGALISLLDRMFYAGGGAFAHKPAAAVVSARRAGTTASLDEINKYFSISQMPIVSSTYWNMVHGNSPEDVQKDLEGLQIMRNLARNMAWLLRCIEAGKEKKQLPPKAEQNNRTNFIR